MEGGIWMKRIQFVFVIIFVMMLLSACGGSDNNAKQDGNYETTKKMVVDILQTEDGKKTLRELMTEEEMKQQLVIESDVVKSSINEMLGSEKGTEMWKKLFSDPSFVEDFAKSISDEQEKLMKKLMNDAEFQKQMMDLLQNPEINEQMLSLMKSQQFRSHLEEVVQQTLETPLFQSKMSEILLKAAEEQQKSQSGGGGEGGKQEGGSSGEGSGDGGS